MDVEVQGRDSASNLQDRFAPHEPLLFAFWFACAGILTDRVFDVSVLVWCAALALALFLWSLSSLIRFVSCPFLAFAVLAFFGAWHQLYWNFHPTNCLARFATEQRTAVCVRATLLEQPRNVVVEDDPISAEIDPEQALFTVSPHAIRGETAEWINVSGRCDVRVRGHVAGLSAGDRVTMFADLSLAPKPMNPGAWDPSRRARMERQLCRLSVGYPECIQLDVAAGWSARWWIPRLRGWFEKALLRHVDGPSGDLAAAVLLGSRDYVARSTIDSFLVTGTVHLLSISGLHVGILSIAVFTALNIVRVPRSANLWIVMLFCLGYAFLTGGRAPVIRATVIVWVASLSLLWYRPCFSFNSLAAAGLIVLALNPAQLFAPGAQLSFVAVAAIVWIVPRLSDRTAGQIARKMHAQKKSLTRMIVARRLRKAMTLAIASMVIWVVALPLVMYHFHIVSPVALALNTFAWLPLSIALLAGFVAMLFAWLPAPCVAVPAMVCRESLSALTELVQFAEGLPGSHFWVGGPPLWSVIGFYAAMGLCLAVPWLRLRWFRSLAAAALVMLASCAVAAMLPESRKDPMELNFLSVGHGTCVVITAADDQGQERFWIYDAGRLGSSRFAVHEISNFLWSRKARRIEGVFLSHADVDHFNAIPGLIQRFDIRAVYTTGAMLRSQQPAAKLLLKALSERKVRVERAEAGDRIAMGRDVSGVVLHPAAGFQSESDNEQSIVLSLACDNRRILLPGDLEGAGLELLLDQTPVDFDLVMAPHHGSYRSEPARFSQWASPDWVVVSGGNPRSARKGKEIFENHGAKVLQTTHDGAIAVRLHAGRLIVEHHLTSEF